MGTVMDVTLTRIGAACVCARSVRMWAGARVCALKASREATQANTETNKNPTLLPAPTTLRRRGGGREIPQSPAQTAVLHRVGARQQPRRTRQRTHVRHAQAMELDAPVVAQRGA
jgi:hypothetical protein